MNVSDMVMEVKRLKGVVEEGKSARPKIKALNTLIAMYDPGQVVHLRHQDPACTRSAEVGCWCSEGFRST